MGRDTRSSRDNEHDLIFMPGGRAAAEKAKLSHLDPELGGGPRCLDSLMDGISSESVFGFL
jgi:hypothetical protein